MSTLKTTNIAHPSSASNNIVLDSSGRVGVGTASPGRLLQVSNTSADPFVSILGAASNNGGLLFGDNASDAVGQIRYDHSVDAMYFATNSSERVRLTASGQLLVGTSSATANGGVLQVSNGITFPATQSACSDANTLDDYEEGTWTPTVIGTVTAGTATYTVRTGEYVKTGRVVTFLCYVQWSSGTGTGDLRIGGLPFTSTSFFPAAIEPFINLTLTANNYVVCRVESGTGQIRIRQSVTGGATDSADVAYDATSGLLIQGSYFV